MGSIKDRNGIDLTETEDIKRRWQEYWSGFIFPSPGDLPNPGTEPRPPALHCRKILYHLRRKVMTNLDSILKNRDITLPTKVRLVKAMVFPVVMYGWES